MHDQQGELWYETEDSTSASGVGKRYWVAIGPFHNGACVPGATYEVATSDATGAKYRLEWTGQWSIDRGCYGKGEWYNANANGSGDVEMQAQVGGEPDAKKQKVDN